ncbi:MAG TPA: hypothetical protein PLI51_07675 [bacterium]|nr:hypothetical protein [bacterium]HPQ66586.1 hypothetical protein [bacterium]
MKKQPENCRSVRELLRDRILGIAGPDCFSERVREHLEDCPGCRAYREELSRAWESLPAAPPVFSPAADHAVVERLEQELKKPPVFPILPLARVAAAAAAVVVLAGTGWFFLVRRPAPSFTEALTFSPSPVRDPDAVLVDYLEQVEEVLDRLEAGGYGTWDELLEDIVSRDLQGRALSLTRTLSPGSRYRELVRDLHGDFRFLLNAGRKREGEAVLLPPAFQVDELARRVRRERAASAAAGTEGGE